MALAGLQSVEKEKQDDFPRIAGYTHTHTHTHTHRNVNIYNPGVRVNMIMCHGAETPLFS